MRKVRFTIAVAAGRTAFGAQYKKGDEVLHATMGYRSGNLVLLKSEVNNLFAKGPEPWFPPNVQKQMDERRAKRSAESEIIKQVRKLIIKGLKDRPGFIRSANMHSRGFGYMSFVLRWTRESDTKKNILCSAHFALGGDVPDGSIELTTGKYLAQNVKQGTFDLVDPKFKELICGTLDKYLDTILI